MDSLLVDQEFRSLIPPPDLSELKLLEESILEEGVRDALVLWNGYIVDGHNRYDIITKHGITDYRVVQKHFADREEAKIWIKKNQIGRRNIAPYLRFEYWKDVKGYELKKQAAKNEKSGTLVSIDTRVNLKETAAQELKIGLTTANRLDQLHEKAPEEIKAKLRVGEISINEAYHNLKGAHVSNNSGGYEWYTPPELIEAARLTMNTIDLDPASSDVGNEIVKARQYYTVQNDGRKQPWQGNVWMNPPYSQPLVTEFCDLLVEKLLTNGIKQACVLVNNATETNFYQNMLRHCQAVCFIKGRVKFIDKKGNSTGVPLQGQTVLYFGDNVNEFAENFTRFGVILHA